MRPRMYGSREKNSLRTTTSPAASSGAGWGTTSKQSGVGTPCGRRARRTARQDPGSAISPPSLHGARASPHRTIRLGTNIINIILVCWDGSTKLAASAFVQVGRSDQPYQHAERLGHGDTGPAEGAQQPDSVQPEQNCPGSPRPAPSLPAGSATKPAWDSARERAGHFDDHREVTLR